MENIFFVPVAATTNENNYSWHPDKKKSLQILSDIVVDSPLAFHCQSMLIYDHIKSSHHTLKVKLVPSPSDVSIHNLCFELPMLLAHDCSGHLTNYAILNHCMHYIQDQAYFFLTLQFTTLRHGSLHQTLGQCS